MKNRRIHMLQIYHDGGVSTFDFTQNSSREYPGKSTNTIVLESTPASLADQINDFVKNIKQKANPVFSLNDEIEVFQLMEKIREKFDLHSVAL